MCGMKTPSAATTRRRILAGLAGGLRATAAAGLLLVITPWSRFWDRNYFTALWPWLDLIMGNAFVKGGVSGIGLISVLADRQMLLVLDNFEQVITAGPQVRDILGACPGVTLLTTSRTPSGRWRAIRWP